jgi:thiol-disulfide isomerase/thioredoxin
MKLVITALALSILAILVYRIWEPFVPARPKKDVPKDTATLYFFYVDWCGFCKKAKPEWEKLAAGNDKFGTTTVKFVKVDAEEDRAKADEYEVDAYPTIKLETPDGIYDFKKSVTEAGLRDFLQKSLGKEATNSK